MKIDLVYYFREVNNFYYLNGPEKVNGNIVYNSPAYQISSANDVIQKINQMIASLAPDITNVGLVTAEQYTGNIQVNTYEGDLNVSSDVPDYTNILTSINSNILDLTNHISNNLANISNSLNLSFNPVVDHTYNTYIGFIYVNLVQHFVDYVYMNRENNNRSYYRYPKELYTIQDVIAQKNSLVLDYKNKIPSDIGYSSISDEVSSNIYIPQDVSRQNYPVITLDWVKFNYDKINYSENKNISEILNERDNVLIIDGQQTFKIRNSDEEF